MTTPTDEEYAAAVERDRTASAAYHEALKASLPLLEESIKAGRELIRLGALRRDLADLILDDMRVLRTRRPWTVKRLAKHTYRSEADVQDVLETLVEAGQLRKVGNAYEAPGAGA
jgi:hypothetical protein